MERPSYRVCETTQEYSFDSEVVTADPKRPDTAYFVWTRFDHYEDPTKRSGPVLFSKTTDGGKTWTPAMVVLPTAPDDTSDAAQIVVDPRSGNLYVITTTGGYRKGWTIEKSSVVFVKSTDGGETWTQPAEIATYVGPKEPVLSPIDDKIHLWVGPGISHAAVDPTTGRLYVTWTDRRYDLKNLAVSVVFSDDAGTTWSAPLQVSTTTNSHAWTPSIAVNSHGLVGISYFDARTAQPGESLLTSLWLKTFRIEGGSLSKVDEHLVDRFNLYGTVHEEYGVGDYMALIVINNEFRPVYVKTHGKSPSERRPNITDVYIGK